MTRPPTKPALGQVSAPDIRLLRIFRTVVECGGFSAAEPELDIARSTISTHIAALERRLELRLCTRGRGGFALTEHGRLVYTEAVKLFASMETFRSHVNAVHRRLSINVRIFIDETDPDRLPAAVDPPGALQGDARGRDRAGFGCESWPSGRCRRAARSHRVTPGRAAFFYLHFLYQ